jgi:hypothetical protein
MRKLALCLSLLSSLHSNGQFFRSNRWHAGFGLAEASVSLNKNYGGSVSVPLRYDFLRFGNSAFSLGSNIKLGSEDQFGYSFPAIMIFMMICGMADVNPDLDGIDISKKVQLFGETPILFHYNFGLGVRDWSGKRFGFYVGGGLNYTTTGFTDSTGTQHAISFPGWMASVGIRFNKMTDLGFCRVIPLPLNSALGSITNPVLYELTLTFFPDKK